jgi:DNA polymerase
VQTSTNTNTVESSELSKEDRLGRLNILKSAAAQCTACNLHTGRTNSVFADGNPNADILIIGEGPGQQEDETGLPFVGRSGKLLTELIEETGLSRQNDTYICNIVKCRPPNNRAPKANEMATCSDFLIQQIQLVQPKFIILVGSTAVKGILNTKTGITKIRGQWFHTSLNGALVKGALAMPVFHPAYLLRNPSNETGKPKWLMRQDLLTLKQALNNLPNLPEATNT